MADRSLTVRLKAETNAYRSEMAGAAKATKAVGEGAEAASKRGATALGGLSTSIRKNRDEWDDLSSKAMIGGAAIAAGLGLAAKAAIDWESAWAGVTKTVDGSDAQMAQLEEDLRGLTKVLPASHQEIAAVAEAAGQLGIATPNVVEFTKTMIDMGESTNLSAEEAATSLARFANVMGTSQGDFDRIGSSIVELGNNFATTEAEIVAMSTRLSGAGRQANLTEGDVLGIATAMSSVGIEAEAGGTAMSKVLIEMGKSVDMGNDKLEVFAKTAGMSTEAFSKLWNENSGEAMQRFITGLGDMQSRGESLEPTLEALGMTDIRVGDALRRSASSADLFTEAMKTGNAAFDENVALQEEAAKRYETTESKLKIARNSIKDAAIDLGSVLGPALAHGAEAVAGIANAFVKLPGPAKTAATAMGGIAASALLIGGGTVKAISGMQKFRGNLESIGALTPRVDRNLTRAQRAVAGFGKALGGLAVVGVGLAALQDDLQVIGSQQLIRDLNDTGDALGSIDAAIAKADGGASDVQDLGKALQVAFDPNMIDKIGGGLDGLFSIFGREKDGEIAMSTRRLEELDSTMAAMVSGGNAEGAQQMMKAIEQTAKDQGISVDELKDKFPLLAEAYAAAENSGDEFDEGMSETEQAAEDAKTAIEDLQDALTMLGGGFRAEQAAARSVDDALKSMQETVKSGKGGWSELSAAMDQSADDALAFASAQVEMGRGSDEIAAGISRVREQVIQAGVDSGKSRKFMEQYADSIGLIPDEAKTMVEAAGVKQSTANIMAMDEQIMLLNGKTVTVKEEGANPSKGRVQQMDGAIFGLKGKTVKVEEIGATASGDRVVRFKGEIYTLRGKTVSVNANVYGKGAVDSLRGAIAALNSKDIYVNNHVSTYRRVVDMGTLRARADGGIDEYADGGIRAFANGGIASIGGQQPQIRAAGGKGILWAEDGAGPWESFISGHPAKAERSKSIWLETGKRLGMIQAYADGGVRDRQYVAPTPTPVVMQAPSAGAVATVDPAQLEAAVERGISKWAPRWGIGDRDLHGVMERTNAKRKGR